MAQRSLFVRLVWFLLVGWWATPIVVNFAWLLGVTVLGIPLAVKLINVVPTVLTLKEPRGFNRPDLQQPQRSLLARALYFLLVGWWLSFLWANVAAFLAVTIIGLPLAVWMFNRLPYVTSLYRFDG
ncbi:YccF domain-containing protein [Halocalculus aciditolerans]|uniref:YccF domain-containing protein n=1 Tax=Halocalculus aciditolerans TaxID=1383812 RepID=A0A830F793_9EURY|nr:YccF domain-containing protein [Halocalculus aciditolerans]GGL46046.1 hypothetical protein GCM10009039_00500 [Halocalculus aciditolerans]